MGVRVMREIKFRAWDIEGKKWYREDLTIAHDGVLRTLQLEGAELHKHDEFIIEQFTGLRDKNGKEICEGDIVKWHLDSIDKYAIIESIPGGFKVQGIRNIPRFYTDILHFIPTEDQECCKYEVIGNIHENPELLK